LCEAGLATAISDTPEAMAAELAANGDIGARLAIKALIWDEASRARINTRLEAETAAFLDRIIQPGTALGMARFLERIGGTVDV